MWSVNNYVSEAIALMVNALYGRIIGRKIVRLVPSFQSDQNIHSFYGKAEVKRRNLNSHDEPWEMMDLNWKAKLFSSFRPPREGWRAQENEARKKSSTLSLSASLALTWLLLPRVSGLFPLSFHLLGWPGWKGSVQWPPWFLSAEVPQPIHTQEMNGSTHYKSWS